MNDKNANAALMASLGITEENRKVFRYKNYTYDSLQQAIDYANLDNNRDEPDANTSQR